MSNQKLKMKSESMKGDKSKVKIKKVPPKLLIPSSCGLFSWFFFWMSPLVNYSKNNFWDQNDYQPLPPSDNPHKQFSKIEVQLLRNKSIYGIIFAAYPLEWLEIIISLVVSSVLKLSVSFLTARIILTIEEKKDSIRQQEVQIELFISFLSIVTATYLSIILSEYYLYRTLRLTNKAKNGLLLKIIQSLMSSKTGDSGSYSLGKIQNFFQVDSDNLDFTFQYYYLAGREALYIFMGVPTAVYFIGPGVLFISLGVLATIIITSVFMWMRVYSQTKLLEAKDQRIDLIESVLSNLQSVKQMGLERYYIKKLYRAREKEITQLRILAIQRFFSNFIEFYSPALLSYPVYLSIAFLLKTSFSFANFSGYLQIQQNILFGFVYFAAIFNFSLSKGVSWTRFASFISLIQIHLGLRKSNETVKKDNVRLKELDSLIKVNLIDLGNTNIIFIIGSNGSGKSLLLKSILDKKVAILRDGNEIQNDKITLMSQENWTFGASIKQNIILGSQFNQKQLDECVKKAELQDELDTFPQGIETMLGEVSSSISGGQLSRVCLARMLYHE